jgi:hypothetical protein
MTGVSGANTMSDGVMLNMLKSMLPLEYLTRALLSKSSIHDINIHAPTEGEVAPSTRYRLSMALSSRHANQGESSWEASAAMSSIFLFSDSPFNDGYIGCGKRSESRVFGYKT